MSGSARSVLLLGAYANGNIGDMYQAEALAGEVQAVDPAIAVSSVSPSKLGAAYPSRNHTALPSDALWDFDLLNSFDAILVGGGGLLAAPHAPLNDSAWLRGVTTRLCAVSLGCARKAAGESREFLDQCHALSVRDEYSAAELAGIRDDVRITMDPILLGDGADAFEAPDPASRSGVVCIAGKLLEVTKPFYERLERELLTEGRDPVASINPATDRRSGFDDTFVRAVEYVSDAQAMHALVTSRKFCVSERYHGCIFALKWGVPCYGIALRSPTVTSKITELYRRLGIPDHLLTRDAVLGRSRLASEAARGQDFTQIAARIAAEREVLRGYLRDNL